MACSDSFVCAEKIEILSYEIEGTGWFIVMLIIAFGLQWLANFIWIQSSQVTREMLQKTKEERGSFCSGLIGQALLWTLVSTVVWIARIVLVMGSNVYIFIVVLLGNLTGVYFTQINQKPDHQYLADDILLMLRRLTAESCNTEIKNKIKEALLNLKNEMDQLDESRSTVGGPGNQYQSQITF